MEGRNSPKFSSPKVKTLKLQPDKMTQNSRSKISPNVKLNEMKLKVYYKQMQKLRKSPEINKISKALVKSKLSASPPRSPYVRRILSSTKFIKSISSQSTTSFVSAIDSPKFAILKSGNEHKPSQSMPKLVIGKSDIFTRSMNMVKRREKALEEIRRLKKDDGMEECTFKPNLIKKQSVCRSQSVNSFKSTDTSCSQDRSQIMRYISLSPAPRRIGFNDGCNLKMVNKNSTPMMRYLALRMPLI